MAAPLLSDIACGVPAVRLDSSLSPEERFVYEHDLVKGKVRLLFVSPERLVSGDFHQLPDSLAKTELPVVLDIQIDPANSFPVNGRVAQIRHFSAE